MSRLESFGTERKKEGRKKTMQHDKNHYAAGAFLSGFHTVVSVSAYERVSKVKYLQQG